MKNSIKLVLGSAVALALFAGPAQAELVLSGNTAGYFLEVSNGNTVVVNGADGMNSSFRTGVPIEGSFKSGVTFSGSEFVNIQSGDTFSLGLFTYYNGVTLIGTASNESLFDFYIDLDEPTMESFLLTQINFGIDATINNSENKNPDFFSATFTQPAPVMIDGTLVQFRINDLAPMTQVKEDTWVQIADVTVTFLSPIPEPSTYGLIGAAGLLGLVGYRRFRTQRTATTA